METPKILFVDDEPSVTAALKRAFRNDPYEILEARSAEQAIEILTQQKIDVIVSDEAMPGMSGAELLARVRRNYPQTIRMILTGRARLEAAVHAINEGEVYRFFIKPCNAADLKATIRQALQQRDLALRSRRLLREYERQAAALWKLGESKDPLTRLRTDVGVIIVDEAEELNVLIRQTTEELPSCNL